MFHPTLYVTVAEIGQFEKTADSLVDILSVQAGKIERQKLMVCLFIPPGDMRRPVIFQCIRQRSSVS